MDNKMTSKEIRKKWGSSISKGLMESETEEGNLMLDKSKLIAYIDKRITALAERVERDFGGQFDGSDIKAYRELKSLKSAVERKLFDVKIWTND